MKFLSFFAGLAGLLFGSTSVIAGTVTVSFTNNGQLVNQGGLMLQNGYAVRVGTFNLPDATRDQTLAKTSDFATLQSWFKPLGEGVSGAGAVSQINGSGNMLRVNGYPAAGDVFGGISNISDSYMAPGTPLYLWVFDNADPTKASQWGIFNGATWVIPQSLGTETLSATAAVGALQGGASAGVLNLTVPKSTFGNWSMKNFAAGTPASAKLATADPSGDGIPNLAKYAWQMNPNAKSVPPTTLGKDAVTGGAKFSFLSPKTLPDVQVFAESSPDLKTWTSASSTIIASDASFDTCQCTVPNGTTKYFWRVRVNSITPP